MRICRGPHSSNAEPAFQAFWKGTNVKSRKERDQSRCSSHCVAVDELQCGVNSVLQRNLGRAQ